jgi:hypothetical protein
MTWPNCGPFVWPDDFQAIFLPCYRHMVSAFHNAEPATYSSIPSIFVASG